MARSSSEHAVPGLFPLLVFLAAFVLLGLLFTWLVGRLGFPPQPVLATPVRSLPAAVAWLAAALLAHALQRRLGGVQLTFAGFPFQPGMYAHLGLGAALGLLLGGLVLGPGVAGGLYSAVLAAQPLRTLGGGGSQAFLLLAPLAAWEELVFRGVLQSFLSARMATWQAVVVQAVLFGLLHAVLMPEAPELAIVGVSLAGVMLGLAYARSGTLWLALGLHLAWNFAEGFLAGLPVSGHSFAATLLQTSVADRLVLVSGGAYGPEAGLLGIGAFAIGVLVLARLPLPGLPVTRA